MAQLPVDCYFIISPKNRSNGPANYHTISFMSHSNKIRLLRRMETIGHITWNVYRDGRWTGDVTQDE